MSSSRGRGPLAARMLPAFLVLQVLWIAGTRADAMEATDDSFPRFFDDCMTRAQARIMAGKAAATSAMSAAQQAALKSEVIPPEGSPVPPSSEGSCSFETPEGCSCPGRRHECDLLPDLGLCT
jgi:hypothetical protein